MYHRHSIFFMGIVKPKSLIMLTKFWQFLNTVELFNYFWLWYLFLKCSNAATLAILGTYSFWDWYNQISCWQSWNWLVWIINAEAFIVVPNNAMPCLYFCSHLYRIFQRLHFLLALSMIDFHFFLPRIFGLSLCLPYRFSRLCIWHAHS